MMTEEHESIGWNVIDVVAQGVCGSFPIRVKGINPLGQKFRVKAISQEIQKETADRSPNRIHTDRF